MDQEHFYHVDPHLNYEDLEKPKQEEKKEKTFVPYPPEIDSISQEEYKKLKKTKQ